MNEHPHGNEPSIGRAGTWALVGLAGAATLALVLLVTAKYLPLGVEGQWEWLYWNGKKWSPDWVLVPVSVLAGAGVVGLFLLGWRVLGRRAWAAVWLLPALLAVGLAAQVGVEASGPAGLGKWPMALYERYVSGYYTEAAKHPEPMRQFLRAYPAFLDSLELKDRYGHLGTHPPGLIVGYKSLLSLCGDKPELSERLLTMAPADVHEAFEAIEERRTLPTDHKAALWLAALLSRLLTVLAIVPIYWLGTMAAGRRAGWLAACLYVLSPATVLFAPKSDTVFPVLAATVVACAWASVGRRRWGWAWVGGLAAWLGLFTTLAFGPVVVLAGVVALGVWWKRRQDGQADWHQLYYAFAAAVAGIFLPIVAMWAAVDFNLVEVWLVNLANHQQFYEQMPRSYWPWVGVNLVEFWVAAGVPLGCMLAAHVWLRLTRPGTEGRLAPVLFGLIGVLSLLNFSGRNLSEVARLWIFLIPFAAVAAGACVKWIHQRPATIAAILLALQFAALLVLNIRVNVLFHQL